MWNSREGATSLLPGVLLLLLLAATQVIGLTTNATTTTTTPGFGASIPRPFDDCVLPASQKTGQRVEHLGRVLLLDTYMSPKSTQSMETQFNVFTRQRASLGVKFRPATYCSLGGAHARAHGPYHYNLDLLLGSGFDHRRRTIIMVPGYLSHQAEPWILEARREWLALEELNVIEVSWSDSNRGLYSTAVAHTPLVARQITIFLHYLAQLSGLDLMGAPEFLANIHVIGHSLGAHIAGFVGQDLGGRLGRITGLDPAGPSFDQFTDQQRLSRLDAKLVDVIYTNRGKMRYINAVASAPLHALSKLPGMNELGKAISKSYSGEGDTAWYGIDLPLGHVNYYANNGRVQPGCSGLLHICDHNRATDIYLEIIRYEARLRGSLDDPGELRRARLLAFKSPDYDTFMSGGNFQLACPELMNITSHLGTPATTSLDSASRLLARCSLPIDLVTPADSLRQELELDYGIDFRPLDDGHRASYYFKTLDSTAAGSSLIGDHYLVKVYFYSQPLWDNASCSLELELEMADGKRVVFELERLGAATRIDHHTPLAMPFVHPDGPRARAKLVELLNTSDCGQVRNLTCGGACAGADANRDLRVARLLRDLLPQSVRVSLTKPKSKTVFGTMKDLTVKMLKLDGDQTCSFSIDMIEVHPIGANYGALYGRPPQGLGGGVRAMKFYRASQLGNLRQNQLIGLLRPDTLLSIKVDLEHAVVGS